MVSRLCSDKACVRGLITNSISMLPELLVCKKLVRLIRCIEDLAPAAHVYLPRHFERVKAL